MNANKSTTTAAMSKILNVAEMALIRKRTALNCVAKDRNPGTEPVDALGADGYSLRIELVVCGACDVPEENEDELREEHVANLTVECEERNFLPL